MAGSVAFVGLCACAPAASPSALVSDDLTSSAPWEQPERVCSTDDNPEPLAWITITPEQHPGALEPHEGVRVPVRQDPQLRTSMSWARAVIEGRWAPTTRTDTKLQATLSHSDDGGLHITFVPYLFTHPNVVGIWISRAASGEVVADLDLTRKIPFEELHAVTDLRGAVVMSSRDWSVGEDIVLHVEVAYYCGELRFQVPPVGGSTPALPHD